MEIKYSGYDLPLWALEHNFLDIIAEKNYNNPTEYDIDCERAKIYWAYYSEYERYR